MSDVKRYAKVNGHMMEMSNGVWVQASDYDALSARCEELERRLAGAWVVRELEWKEDGERQCHADTAIGRIVIRQQYYDQKWWVDAPTRYSSSELYDSLAAAKAAAQAWFNEKMTAGLRRGGEQLTLTKESLR